MPCRLALGFAVLCLAGWLAAGCEDEGILVSGHEVDRGPDILTSDSFLAPLQAPLAISSTFGPRWKFSESRFDFHRGIDYFGSLGDPILAIGGGTVTGLIPEGSPQFPDGGNTLIVRHGLAAPFEWQGATIDRIYAVYLHLQSFLVALDDPVIAGAQIATMGATGSTPFVHLHFEIRMQTACSLEFQLANPASSCAQWGFDPHVHPYAFVGGENTDTAIASTEQPGSPFVVTYQATRGDLDLNELRTNRGTIAFNRRAGIDAGTTATLDDFDYGWVTIVPDVFLSTSDTIAYEFRFPAKPNWVELTDIHGWGLSVNFD
ncbi:MAG: M23 family metallopeptidase [SAR324 cluster bacterium]|nr:M23 family metallopeptidase [SAR324 cluster bacterium]